MPNYPMRRKDRAMTDEDAARLLREGEYGVLSTADATGIPYGVPLSYVVQDGQIYFHCAHTGRKIDNLADNARISFCVVGKTRPIYQKSFTTLFESVIVEGIVHPVEEDAEKYKALYELCQKYLPEHMDKADAEITGVLSRTAIYMIDVQHLCGKRKA